MVFQPLALFWRSDPDYAFGWGVPLLAAYLIFARWSCRPIPAPVRAAKSNLVLILFIMALALLLNRLLLEVVPDWRPALWAFTCLYLGGLLAWCWLHGGRAWSRHFLFPVGFVLCGVPWLYNLETPLVQFLMRANAALVADSLTLADIPARAAGNTLILATGQLGIAEACSGLRSLQAAVMMGLFLGEFHRFHFRKRLFFLFLSLFFALLGNYLRLLYLAGRGARGGISSVEAMHGSAGAVILIFTLAGLWLAGLALRKFDPQISRTVPDFSPKIPIAPHGAATFWAAGILVAVLADELATQSWFRWHEFTQPSAAVWTVEWPQLATDFQLHPIPASTHELLHDQKSVSASWIDDQKFSWQAFWFAYPPQAINRIAADVHRPEVCLTGAGWHQDADLGSFPLSARHLVAPVHAYRFTSGATREYVFWLVTLDRDPSSKSDSRRAIYLQTPSEFCARLILWSREAAHGIRSIRSETLELAIAGPSDFPTARRAFERFAQAAIVDSPPAR